jgi:hypothetical protein
MSDDERRKLVSTEQSLGMEADRPRVDAGLTGLEVFGDEEKDESRPPISRMPTASSTCPPATTTRTKTTTAARTLLDALRALVGGSASEECTKCIDERTVPPRRPQGCRGFS